MQEIEQTGDQVLTDMAVSVADAQVLQSLIWPDAAVHPDIGLCLRLGAGAAVAGRAFDFPLGGTLRLDTAYNLFSWVKWHRDCGINAVQVRLRGSGQFSLRIEADGGEQTWVRKHDLTLTEGAPATLDLTDWLATCGDCVVHLSLHASQPGQITAVDWCTPQAPLRRPKLLLCVTTFRREEAATATALRLNACLAADALADLIHLVVVDNGQSLTLPDLPHVTLIANRNLGGSGGFARGLAEAVARDDTHCLFMDDDAWVDWASIVRTWTFLAYVTDPSVAIAGMLTRGDDPTVVWENGAVFRGNCGSLFKDMSLLDYDGLTAVELSAKRGLLPNVYGAFWFFAFPIGSVKHWPFPFFVRGDDINFSIVNPFRILTLPGVISYQAHDFSDKDTPLAQYLSLRCDLLQVLLLDHMPRRFVWAIKVPCSFFMRMLVLVRIDSMHAVNLALEDLLEGPSYFAANADVAKRRAEIMGGRLQERWVDVTEPLPPERRNIDPNAVVPRLVMKLSVNGFLLPYFSRWGNQIHLQRNHRKLIRNCWGAAQVTYLSRDEKQAMTVHQDKRAILREGLRIVWNVTRLLFGYRRVLKMWQTGFAGLTSPAFWQDQFRQPPKP